MLGSSYDKFAAEVDFSRVTYPAGMEDIKRFEEDNKHLTVNVFVHSEGEFYAVHSTKPGKSTQEIGDNTHSDRKGVNIVQNTMLDWESGEITDHFYPVTNLSRFSQKVYRSKTTGNISYGKTVNCDICAQSFRSFNKPQSATRRRTSFNLESGELHLGMTQLNMSQAFIDHRFRCGLGIVLIM